MADMEVKLDPMDVERVTRMLSYVPRSVPRIFSRALNKTATTARKESAQAISKASGMKVNLVRKMIRMIPATMKRWIAMIRVSDRKIPAVKFVRVHKRKKGLTYSVPTEAESLEFKGKQESEEPIFVATMPSGYVGLFQRLGIARYPIQPVFGPSLGQVFAGSQGIVNQIYQSAASNLARNVESQVRLVLEKGA